MTEDDSRRRRLALRQYDVLQSGPEEEFEQIVALTCLLFSTPVAAITLRDGQRHRLKSQRGLPRQDDAPSLGFLDRTLAAAGALVVEDARHDRRFSDDPLVAGPPGYRAFLGAALCTPDGTRVGTIFALDTVAREFSPTDAEVMEQLARITAATLELRLIARKDAASGAHARRAFLDVVGRELERYRRTGTRSTLLVCHREPSAGADRPDTTEAAIAALADRLRRSMRKTDALGRVGPATLAILLADVGADRADAAVDRFREAIRDAQNETATISFGHVVAASHLTSGSDWLAAAEAAARPSAAGAPGAAPDPVTHLGIGDRWLN
jgi:GAF domain-containing protein